MKRRSLKWDGASMDSIQPISGHEDQRPTWNDVYIDGQLTFENVFVLIQDNTLYLYNGIVETPSKEIWQDRAKLVAIVRSENYIVVARRSNLKLS